MSSIFDQKDVIEAALRTIAIDTGAQICCDPSAPRTRDKAAASLHRSATEAADEAECEAYQRMMRNEVDLPPDVDLINTWEEIRDDEDA